MVRSDRRVLRRFDGLVYWVTLGRDARRGPLTDKVNDLIRWIEPDRPVTFTDAQQAGRYLASLLTARPRRLIVLDDVWYPEQIEAFPTAARSTLLVTTRNPSIVADRSVPIRVDQLSDTQARALLQADLPQMPATTIAGFLRRPAVGRCCCG